MKKPMAIIFDLGSTIIKQTATNRLTGITRLLELAHNPRKITVQEIIELLGELENEVKARRKESMVEIPIRSLHKLLFDWYNISFDLSPLELELEYWKSTFMVALEPDARRSIEAMYKTNLPLAIVTNSPFSGDVLKWELACHNLDSYFRFIMSSADYGFRKPHPLLFQGAAERLFLEPYEIWYVGDSFNTDVLGAVNAGMKPIWYNPGHISVDENFEILEVNSWLQLVELLVEVL